MNARIASLVLCLLLAGAPGAHDHSAYVPMDDGVRLAVDVHLPDEAAHPGPWPALFELTRYWRASLGPDGTPRDPLSGLDRAFLAHGYALVKVDVRGSGASFGVRDAEYGTREVRDGHALVEWAVEQPWCDGNVGAYGTSYTGTTAELLAASGHPALKAVIPGWSDFDLYESPARPYGLLASVVVQWGGLVARLDANDPTLFGGTVRPVDGAEEQLAEALAEHEGNVDVGAAVRRCAYRDDALREGGDSYEAMSPRHWKDAIEASGTPMLVLASWLDAGTAKGALDRLASFSNPQNLVILGSSHGGLTHASPYVVDRQPRAPVPSLDEQVGWRLDFLDHHLRGVENGVEDWPTIRYFHLGEERMRSSEAWPPKGTAVRRAWFRADGGLAFDAPSDSANDEGVDRYTVDFGVTTGRATRWSTQLGGPVLGLSERGAMDERMLTYTTAPLAEPLHLTGTVRASLALRCSSPDAALLVYLEDVDPAGRSRYVTEGGLRLANRAGTHRRADSRPMSTERFERVELELWPTSVRLAAGHRLRIAIAGADADNLERCPPEGTPAFELARSAERASFVELPVRGDD